MSERESSRRRHSDRRRGAGGAVGGVAARATAEGCRQDAQYCGARESRRARRASAVGGGARSARAGRADSRFRVQRRAACVEGARRSHLLPYLLRQDQIPDHATAAPESRQLHHLRPAARQMAFGPCRSGRHRHVFRVCGHRVVDGGKPGRRCANGRPGHRPSWRETRDVRAGCRHPRQGHHPRRWRSRESDEAADSALAHHGGQRSRSCSRSASRNCGRCLRAGCLAAP